MKKPNIDRCCCTCDRNKSIMDGTGHTDCICEIDGHRIGYAENFEYSCRRYALDKRYKSGGKRYKSGKVLRLMLNRMEV